MRSVVNRNVVMRRIPVLIKGNDVPVHAIHAHAGVGILLHKSS